MIIEAFSILLKMKITELFELVLMAYVQAFSDYKQDNKTAESILKKLKVTSFDEIGIYLHLQH